MDSITGLKIKCLANELKTGKEFCDEFEDDFIHFLHDWRYSPPKDWCYKYSARLLINSSKTLKELKKIIMDCLPKKDICMSDECLVKFLKISTVVKDYFILQKKHRDYTPIMVSIFDKLINDWDKFVIDMFISADAKLIKNKKGEKWKIQ